MLQQAPAAMRKAPHRNGSLVDFVDRAVEQHIVIGHVEKAVIVDPTRLDPNRSGDEGREKGAFRRLFGILTVEHRPNVADVSRWRQVPCRHCEERSDEAIQGSDRQTGLFRGACHRTGHFGPDPSARNDGVLDHARRRRHV